MKTEIQYAILGLCVVPVTALSFALYANLKPLTADQYRAKAEVVRALSDKEEAARKSALEASKQQEACIKNLPSEVLRAVVNDTARIWQFCP